MLSDIHGVINLNKPPDLTSQQAVTKVKRIFGARKAGHTGTLDPMATGVLLVCLNEATKLSSFLTGVDKQYSARGKLGERTDTFDAEGAVVERKDSSHITEEQLREVILGFTGKIRQKTPMYSAVKIDGERLYNLARKGVDIDRPERTVHIPEIRLAGADIPFFDFSVVCSKGTYVRALCDDIGMKLGTGAHLVSLVRTKVGSFDIQDAVSLSELSEDNTLCSLIREARQADTSGLYSGRDALMAYLLQKKYFIPCDRALYFMEKVRLKIEEAAKIKQGQQIIYTGKIDDNSTVRLIDEAGSFFGLGLVSGRQMRMTRLLKINKV